MTTEPAMIFLDGAVVPSRESVGNKAHGLARMRSRGLPVPPAFVLPTAIGRRCADGGLPDDVWQAVLAGVAILEAATGRRFGDAGDPLLVSVRSGAAQSMPGMMDTILNLGAVPGCDDFTRDTRERFEGSWAKVVGGEAPEDAYDQLHRAICAVFASWNSPRARTYREHQGVPHDGGTAVTVQAMVFGNRDDRSGTGVMFTRDVQTGEPGPTGEFLPRGQGEDVVSGEVTPLDLAALAELLPEAHAALLIAGEQLEREVRDVQDIEFTVESGVLYLLQTRTAKRSPRAAVRIAVDLVDEGVIDPGEAIARVTKAQVEMVLRPVLAGEAAVLATGHPACPGIASGRVVTDPDEAMTADDDVVLVRHSTSPDDLHGMLVATAICTEVGGHTSHAAVVSRELGLPAVVGCGSGVADLLAGRVVTVDGATGRVLDGEVAVRTPTIDEIPGLARLVEWGLMA